MCVLPVQFNTNYSVQIRKTHVNMVKKWLTLAPLLGLMLVLMSHQTAKKPLLIKLAPKQIGTEMWATMTFTNQSGQPIYLNKIDICFDGKLLNNVFQIQKKGKPLDYTGVLVKRRTPTAADFVLLQPRKSITTKTRLDKAYAFQPGKHQYTIQYSHYHGSPKNESTLNQFTSAAFPFVYTSR